MKSQFLFVCLYYTIMIPSWKIKIVRKIHIQPNLLRNWKKEFLANASLAFDNKREDNLREKLAEERKEKAEYAKKVGQLTMQVDWLKKNLKKLSDLTTRVNLVRIKILNFCLDNWAIIPPDAENELLMLTLSEIFTFPAGLLYCLKTLLLSVFLVTFCFLYNNHHQNIMFVS